MADDDKSEDSITAVGTFSLAAWQSGEYWTRFPPDLPPEYYQAIGEVCSRWSWLERQLAVIAREALGLEKAEGFSVMAGMSMRTITAVLKGLAAGGFPKGHPGLSILVGEIGTALGNIGDMRNQYAHAIWAYENETNPRLGMLIFSKPEEKAEPRWADKPLSSIQADAKTLAELQAVTQQLTRDLKNALRGKSRPQQHSYSASSNQIRKSQEP